MGGNILISYFLVNYSRETFESKKNSSSQFCFIFVFSFFASCFECTILKKEYQYMISCKCTDIKKINRSCR